MERDQTTTEFLQIIDHLQYPTTKNEVLGALRTEGSGNGVVDIGDQLPDKIFNSPQEVKAVLA